MSSEDTTEWAGPAVPTSIDSLLDSDVDGLLDTPETLAKATAADRLQRSFLDVVEFRRTHDRVPESTTREIAERKLGARLDGILADGEKVAALKVERYFDQLVAGKSRLRPLPSALASLLREHLDYSIHEAGVSRAFELASEERSKTDSAAAPGAMQRAPGPPPVPGARPSPRPAPQPTPRPAQPEKPR